MRIVVNELQALKQRTGIGHYTAELLAGLRRQAAEDQIEGFPQGWSRPIYRLALGGGRKQGSRGTSRWARYRDALACRARRGIQAILERRFRAFCTRAEADLYHEPNTLPFAVDCPTIATIHDLSLLLHPDWHPSSRVDFFSQHLPAALERCCHFITDSECVRRQVIGTLGVAAEKVSCIPLGVRRGLGPLNDSTIVQGLARLDLPGRYLLHVGTLEPRKNVLMLLRAYCSLPADLRAAWPLVLVGGWGWNFEPIADYYHTVARHRGVRLLGYLPDQALPVLYNGARALLYPSHYEGFGLPPLEMLACGGAVLASTAEAVQEVAGPHAHYLPPEDQEGWRRALLRVVNDDDWWMSLRQGAVAAARPFTWERTAAETLDLYRRLTGNSQKQAA